MSIWRIYFRSHIICHPYTWYVCFIVFCKDLFSNCEKWEWKSQSCLTLCDPMDYIIHGILQARILEWVAFPFSRGSSQPRDQTQVSRIAGGFFTSWATREAHLWKNPVLFWHHKIYITTAFFLMHLVCYLSILPTSLKHFEVYLLLLWIYQYIISLWKAKQEVILLSLSCLFVYEVIDHRGTI